jgi:hypothetical protein
VYRIDNVDTIHTSSQKKMSTSSSSREEEVDDDGPDSDWSLDSSDVLPDLVKIEDMDWEVEHGTKTVRIPACHCDMKPEFHAILLQAKTDKDLIRMAEKLYPKSTYGYICIDMSKKHDQALRDYFRRHPNEG